MPETDGSDAATQPLLLSDSEAQQLTVRPWLHRVMAALLWGQLECIGP